MKTEFEKFEWQMARWLETISETETLHFMINAFENATPKNFAEADPSFEFKRHFAYLFALQGVEAKKCLTDWLTLHFSTAENQGEFYKIFLAYRAESELDCFVGCGEINLPNERAQTLFSGYELIQTIQTNAGYSPPALTEGGLILEPPFLIRQKKEKKTQKKKRFKIV